MKKITILLVIIFTFLFSTTSCGEWSYFSENVNGWKFYYDKDRVRKSGKFLYLGMLVDLKELSSYGHLSSISYIQVDCSIFRYNRLKNEYYTNSMSEGNMIIEQTPLEKWNYPRPDSSEESMYNKICEEHQ